MSNIERVIITDESGTYDGDARVEMRALVRIECNCYVCARDGAHYLEIIVALGTMLVRNVATETSFYQRTRSGPFQVHIEDTKREKE